MTLRTTVVGNYPKLPSQKGDVNIRRVLHRYDKQEIDRQQLDDAFNQVTARVIREQVSAGIDLPTDGQIRWDDVVTPFASRTAGFEINGLIRWFDNNVYYRKPLIVSQIKPRDQVAANLYRFATTEANGQVKAVLPAPYSFAKLSEDKFYGNMPRLLNDLVPVLKSEVDALIAAGAKEIQFDEPCLPFAPQDADIAADAFNQVVSGSSANFWLCFYFSDIGRIADALPEYNVQVIAADCVSHAGNLEVLMKSAAGKNACFGLLEARNIKLESEDDLLRIYEKVAARYPNGYISPSCGLEFLPHESALAKINLLGRTVKAFNGGRVNA